MGFLPFSTTVAYCAVEELASERAMSPRARAPSEGEKRGGGAAMPFGYTKMKPSCCYFYSGYWLKKSNYPKSGLDSVMAKFRPISGCMNFFNQ